MDHAAQVLNILITVFLEKLICPNLFSLRRHKYEAVNFETFNVFGVGSRKCRPIGNGIIAKTGARLRNEKEKDSRCC